MFGEGEHQSYEISQHNRKICLDNVEQLADQLIAWDRCEEC
jgi:hypothetical protein